MTRSSRPRKPTKLPDSVQHQLTMYALAAGAAGAGMLVLGLPAEAKIIYTPADKSIMPNHTIPLDLNHDGTIDFRFKDMHFTSPTYGFDHTGILSIVPAHQANRILGHSRTNRHYASALRAAVWIGPKKRFTPGPKIMATVFSDTGARRELSDSCNGPWSGAKDRYLGLKFFIKGEVHFGWARLNVSCPGTDVVATLTGYAYETIPNKPILAGQTTGSDQESSVTPDAALTAPAPKPATLGVLALGSPGLSIWRREDAAGAARVSR